jgi:hypothetical protein
MRIIEIGVIPNIFHIFPPLFNALIIGFVSIDYFIILDDAMTTLGLWGGQLWLG